MKTKIAYLTITILVLLISVIRIFGEPDKNSLEIPASAFPKSTEHEVEIIKEMIRQTLSETGTSRKIPLSMVYIDKSEENSDAILSGGGASLLS